MTEPQQPIDLVSLFEAAAQAVAEKKDDINALDGYNGNHGDNMVENVRLMADAVREHKADSPDEALRSAAIKLQEQGQGGTSQYYSRGLLQAAQQFTGKPALNTSDGLSLIQSLLGALPAQGHPQTEEAAPSVLDLFLGGSGPGGQAQAAPPAQAQAPAQSGGGLLEMLTGLAGGAAVQQQQEQQPQPSPVGGLLEMLTGLGDQGTSQQQQQQPAGGGLIDMLTGLAGGAAQPQAQTPAAQTQDDGLDVGDVLAKLLPAGLSYLQAKQAGATSAQAMQAALISAVLGTNPAQAQTPRQGAGAALAQGMLKALLGRR